MILTNYHTHTNFCDGKEEPETMVQEAIACGLSVLGFSGHSIYPFASDWDSCIRGRNSSFARGIQGQD